MDRKHSNRLITLARVACALTLGWPCGRAFGFEIRDAISPRNSERAVRRQTRYIVLHTTEGPDKGSINKIRERGEAHYAVDSAGVVHRIVDRRRVAFHAGRSMWDNKTDMDMYAIGIEVVGYHNQDINEAQYQALRELLRQLQRLYRIPDQRVLSHSMVAYGAPNRWHRQPHRGRKRCGMQFARTSVRAKLGLKRKPEYDPDVRAGRLVEADPYLARVLYGPEPESVAVAFADGAGNVIAAGRSAWDIARDKYNSADTLYIFPDGTRQRGNAIDRWRSMPSGTRVVLGETQRDNEEERLPTLGVDGNTASEIAGNAYNKPTTLYVFPNGRLRHGGEMSESDFKKLPTGTRVLIGYVAGGAVTEKRSAFDISGPRWNHPSTYYFWPDGVLKRGDEVKEGAIPVGVRLYYRR